MEARSILQALGMSAMLCGSLSAADLGQIDYRVKLRLSDESRAVEGRLRLHPTPIALTANRVKKARLGGWRFELQGDLARLSPTTKAWLEGLFYLSGPDPRTRQQSVSMNLEGRASSLWSVEIPAGLQAYAYLAEVKPGVLALHYFSGVFPGRDVASAEIQMEGFRLSPAVAPAEDGARLLRSLRTLAQREPQEGVEVIH